MTSRRSMRSEIAAIGKTPSADPNAMEDVNNGAHADAEGENRSEREQGAVRSAAASTAQHESGAMLNEPEQAGTHAARLSRWIDAGHRHRHNGEREQRATDCESGKTACPKRLQRQLPACGSSEVCNLIV
jgi:hypothetical protein